MICPRNDKEKLPWKDKSRAGLRWPSHKTQYNSETVTLSGCPTRNPKLPSDSLGYGDDILMLEKSVAVQKMEVYGCSVKKWDNLAFWHFDEINDVRKSSKIGPHSGRILIKRCLFSIVKLLTCKSALQDYVYRSTANCDLMNLLKLIGKYNAPQCLFECGRGVQLPK